MDTVYNDKINCCGCSLCEYACPVNAVKMVSENGFLFPEIDKTKCVDCGKCERSCPFNRQEPSKTQTECFAAIHNEKAVVGSSSSGGVFTALSDAVLKENGVVFGAAYNSDMRVVHKAAVSKAERDGMKGSKYIQSDMTGVYSQISDALKLNKPVLFTGTPCQVSAVRNAFRDSENLFLADIFCHGVPNPLVWEKFVEFIEKKYGKKLCDYKFRDKTNGWKGYSAAARFTDGTELKNNDCLGSFIEIFRYDVCMRPSCTVCPYASTNRPGDISIGDFWGIENVFPEIDDNTGVSAVICNTEKGKRLLSSASSDLRLIDCTVDNISARQPNLSRPSGFSNKADAFSEDFKSLPFDTVLQRYTRVGMKRRVIDLAKKVLKK